MPGFERPQGGEHEEVPNNERSEVTLTRHSEDTLRIGTNLLTSDTNIPFHSLPIVQEVQQLPENTNAERTFKLQKTANVMKATLYSLFDTPIPGYEGRSIAERTGFVLDNTAVTSNKIYDLEDPQEQNDRLFVATGYAHLGDAIEETYQTDVPYAAEKISEILESYQGGLPYVTDQAQAEAGVSYAGLFALGGESFARETGLAAKNALDAADRHAAETGEELLSAGEKYVLGALLSRAEMRTDKEQSGESVQTQVWDELGDSLRLHRPWEWRRFTSMRDFFYDKSRV